MSVEEKHSALVAARDLPKVIEEAVHAAGLRTGTAGALVLRWDLAGKIVRDWAEGEKFANEVSHHITAKGIQSVPAVMAIDKKIIAGFIERVAVPQIRNL